MAEEIRSISLSRKKSFSIDGDINRIIQLDTSDMNIMVRLEETYPEIQQLAIEAVDRIVASKDSEDENSSLTAVLKDIDNKIREKINYIFASDVADACEPTGNMYDPIEGDFRFEHIIQTLLNVYADDILAGFKQMQARVKKHTAKYTNTGASTSKRKKSNR